MRQEITNPLGRIFLTVDTDARNKWIHVNWMGYLTAENIKTGANTYTDALVKANFNCVLNDTRLVIGPWDHSMDWVINEWSPRAARAGLRHFAMVVSPESFAESSAKAFARQLSAFEARMFSDLDEAKEWLRKYSLPLVNQGVI